MKVIRKPDKIKELILRTKAELQERPDKMQWSSLDYVFFYLIGYNLEREGEGRGGVRLKLDVQGQGDGRILDVAGQGGWGVLKIGQFWWTSYVYCP